MTDSYRTRIIKMAEKDFFHLEDGYLYWGPGNKGAIGSHELRIIANELDRRNEEWDRQVREDLGGN